MKKNKQLLAALNWGLLQEWDKDKDLLGIDLQPQPHFVRYSH